MPMLFRLRFAVILSAILVLYGWAGQRDYEDQRAAECAQRGPSPGQGYDPSTDTCTIVVPSSRASGASTPAKAR